MASVATISSSTVIPATKRFETFCPTDEFSATERMLLLSESAIKKERSIADPSTEASAPAISWNYEVVIAAGKLAPIKPARRLFTGTVTYVCITPSRYSEMWKSTVKPGALPFRIFRRRA
jgi:hypothetical protein